MTGNATGLAEKRMHEKYNQWHDTEFFDRCAYWKSNPNIFVVQSAEDWAAKNTPCPLHGAR
jgi:hypothetical protein